MFTGIIETIGEVTDIRQEGSNIHFFIASSISSSLQKDDSVNHNGVCLTIEEANGSLHRVTAIEETLQKTTLKHWRRGTCVNLERALPATGRFDGHFVQGHIDQTAQIGQVEERQGSWLFTFEYEPNPFVLIVNKGSVCVDGVSLTVVSTCVGSFQVAIIPYTYKHTIFQYYQPGDQVNVEFDIIGKYLVAQWQSYREYLIRGGGKEMVNEAQE